MLNKNQSISLLDRRPEIDALRAVAVLAVVGFHFFPEHFELGFLGVDLFFVISGYLITQILQKQLLNNKFRFPEFYLRRIKRIAPAVLVMLSLTSFAALFILISSDLVKFAYSLLSSLGLVANLYFWRNGGYFSTSDELKPLLHMWSLGVEEQFYLIFPVALILIMKFFSTKRSQLLIITFLSITSYGLNYYLISIGGSNPAFFLLPTRIWQFGIGCFFALIPVLNHNNSLRSNYVFHIGLFLIFINLIIPVSIIPIATFLCIGTGLILWHGIGKQSVITKVIRFVPIQLVGLCSFSIYLWHWPIIVFLKYIYVEEIPVWVLFSALIFIFFIAFSSWKYIEKPFRYDFSKKIVLSFILFFYLILIFLSIVVISAKGFPNRDSYLVNSIAQAVDTNFRCPPSTYRFYGASRACLIGESNVTPRYALLGNSHAQMYAPALNHYLKESKGAGLLIPLNSCLPTINVNLSMECLEKSTINYEAVVNDKNIKTVIIGLTWYSNDLIDRHGNRLIDVDLSVLKNDLLSLIYGLEEAGKEVYLIGPIAIPNFDFASVTSRNLKFNEKEVLLSSSRQKFNNTYEVVNLFFLEKLNKNFITPHTTLCDHDKCYFADSAGSYFADSNHLSSYGVSKLYPLFKQALGIASK